MARHPRPDPPSLPAVLTRAQALAAGLTRDEVAGRVASGQWVAIRHGVLLRRDARLAVPRSEMDRDLQHAYEAAAAALPRKGAVISHGSAAVVHRLPLVSGTPALPHLTSPATATTGRRAGAVAHQRRLSVDDWELLDLHELWTSHARGEPLADGVLPSGLVLPVTTPLRTVLDSARTLALPDALAVGDRALRLRLVSVQALLDNLGRLHDAPGTRRARIAIGHMDGLRETALESFSFARFIEWDLPLPSLQVEVRLGDGRVARLDFLWEQFGVAGEADGAVKYESRRDLLDQGQREASLRDMGFAVVRWTWGDLATGRLRARLLAALSRRAA